ncbi:MAG: SDR family oxidoreductase [Bdellovibrionales bacterium]|nr:SDR family oxidoreductase [Bdellovibrionales bacterium]
MQTRFEDMKGKWALILGVSSGFGAATAKALARAGMNICGLHLDRKSGMPLVDQLVQDLEDLGAKTLFFNCNAADAQKREQVLQDLSEKKIKIHVLLHSLAFGTLKPYLSTEDALGQKHMEMTLDVMAHSLVYWTQGLLAYEVLDRGGRVFAMTSAGGERVWKSYGAVSAAKAALESHIRQLALELAPYEITANSIRAGVTDTPALRKIPGNQHMIELATSKNPFGRLTTPEDVAQAIVALSLPQCSWISGNVLGIDGGENIVD